MNRTEAAKQVREWMRTGASEYPAMALCVLCKPVRLDEAVDVPAMRTVLHDLVWAAEAATQEDCALEQWEEFARAISAACHLLGEESPWPCHPVTK